MKKNQIFFVMALVVLGNSALRSVETTITRTVKSCDLQKFSETKKELQDLQRRLKAVALQEISVSQRCLGGITSGIGAFMGVFLTSAYCRDECSIPQQFMVSASLSLFSTLGALKSVPLFLRLFSKKLSFPSFEKKENGIPQWEHAVHFISKASSADLKSVQEYESWITDMRIVSGSDNQKEFFEMTLKSTGIVFEELSEALRAIQWSKNRKAHCKIEAEIKEWVLKLKEIKAGMVNSCRNNQQGTYNVVTETVTLTIQEDESTTDTESDNEKAESITSTSQKVDE